MKQLKQILLMKKKRIFINTSNIRNDKEYLGQELDIEKIHELKNKTIEKYYNRYQLVQGKKVAGILKTKEIKLKIDSNR